MCDGVLLEGQLPKGGVVTVIAIDTRVREDAPHAGAPVAVPPYWGPAELIGEARRLYNLSLAADDHGELLARASVLASLAGAMATQDHERYARERHFAAHGCAD